MINTCSLFLFFFSVIFIPCIVLALGTGLCFLCYPWQHLIRTVELTFHLSVSLIHHHHHHYHDSLSSLLQMIAWHSFNRSFSRTTRVHRYHNIFILDSYAPPLIGGGIKRRCCLTSVCLSLVYVGTKSRT